MEVDFSIIPFSLMSADDWQELFLASDSSCMFQQYGLLAAAAAGLGQPLRVLKGEVRGKCVLLLPFTQKESRWGQEFHLFAAIGADHVQPLCRMEERALLTRQVLRFIRYELQVDLLWGRGVSADFLTFIRGAADELPVFAEGQYLCPFIELPAGNVPFLSLYKSKFRNNLKRKIKKAQKDRLQFRILNGSRMPEGYSLSAAFDNLCRLHRARFAALGKTSGFLREVKLDFHRRLMKREEGQGTFVVFAEILSGDKVVGSNYGFWHKDRYGLLQQGYNPGFSEYAPGKLLFYYTAEHLGPAGLRIFDFLRGDEAYKTEWATGTVSTYQVGLPFTSRGRLFLQRRLWADQARRKGRLAGTRVWWRQLVDYELRRKSVFEIHG